MIFTDSLSVPMIMGNGPINMMPAPFVLGFVLATEMAIDKKMSTNPKTINIKPMIVRKSQSDICVRQVKHKKVEIIKV
jgi:hypothetical protein